MSVLDGLFGKYRIICPYCLTETRSWAKAQTCPRCKETLPPLYVEYASIAPALFIQVIGWTQTGKTLYLDAQTHMLNQIAAIWNDYACVGVTEDSQSRLQRLNVMIDSGQLPLPNARGQQNLYVMCLLKMPRWDGCSLVIRDYAGELFDTMTIPDQDVPYLTKAPTVFMFIDLSETRRDAGGRTMNMLLTNYINTLLSKKVNLKKERRDIVVVFTKADKLVNRLSPSLQQYLHDDPLWTAVRGSRSGPPPLMDAVALQGYLARMKEVSLEIKDWMRGVDPTANALQAFAALNNIELRFSLTSSLGADVPPGMAIRREQFAPRRVLDPLFWALELNRR